MYSTAYNLWTFTLFVHFELPFGWKGLTKFIPRDCLNSTLIYILFSLILPNKKEPKSFCLIDSSILHDCIYTVSENLKKFHKTDFISCSKSKSKSKSKIQSFIFNFWKKYNYHFDHILTLNESKLSKRFSLKLFQISESES